MARFRIPEQQTIAQAPTGSSQAFQAPAAAAARLGETIKDTGQLIAQYEIKKGQDWLALNRTKMRAWGEETLRSVNESAQPGDNAVETIADGYEEYKAQALASAPNSAKAQAELDFAGYFEEFKQKALSSQAAIDAQGVVDTAQEMLDLGRNTVASDPDQLDISIANYKSFINNQSLPADAKRDLIRSAEEGFAKSAIQGLGFEEALAVLESDALDAYLDPDQKQTLIAAKQREFNAFRNEQKQAAEAQRLGQVSDLEIAVSRGQATYTEIEDAYAGGAGWLKPAERTRLTKALDSRTAKMSADNTSIDRINLMLEAGVRLDPKSTQDRKDMNAHYKAKAANWADLPPEEVLGASVDYSLQMGLVPDPVKGMIRGNLRSGSSEQKVLAANTLSIFRSQNPDILNEFSNQDISLGNLIATYAEYGASPQEAVRLAEEAMKVSEVDRALRKKEYADLNKESPAIDWISDTLAPDLFDSAPEVPAAMAERFNQFAQAEYLTHGNADAARTSALDRVMRTWGESGMNGQRQFMRNAPEKFYGVRGLDAEKNTEWMQEQLYDDVRASTFGGVEDIETKVYLAVAPNQVSPEGMPLYHVYLTDADGIARRMRDGEGSELTWQPDWESSKMKARFDAETKKEVESAKRARELSQMTPAQRRRSSRN